MSKYCLTKIKCYKCSKRHHVSICYFEKIDSNTQVPENHTSSNDDSTPRHKERLNSKTTASRDVMIKVLGNQVLQEN